MIFSSVAEIMFLSSSITIIPSYPPFFLIIPPHFQNGKQFSGWLDLTPKMNSEVFVKFCGGICERA